MKRVLGVVGLVLGLALSARAEAPPDVREAIVKIYTIQDRPDYYNPWSMQGPRSATGSGCILRGRKILTNAHVVSDQTFLQVRRYGEAKKYEAHVLSISHEADLALLTVDDAEFFDGAEELDFGDLPEAQQEVLVYGFPLGGDTLSITKGVVSRIEHQIYSHSSGFFLAGQIDAAINPGNSGGPVVMDNRIVGVVMQSISQADNIGYMVPVTIIQHFLDDLADGRYDGFPSMGVILQDLENVDLKARHTLPEDRTGLLIIRVLPGSPAEGRLKDGDVLVSVEGHAIADDGTVEFRPKERTSVSYYIQQHQLKDNLPVDVWRDGRVEEVTLPLNRPTPDDLLVPNEAYDIRPTYYIYGGLVFCPLSKSLLQAWGGNWYQTAPKELVAILSANYPEVEGEQVVLLLKVLASDINEGYHEYANWVITEVNGQKINNLRDLIQKVETDDGAPFVVFESNVGQRMALRRDKVKERQDQILKTYRVVSDRSEDLKESTNP